MKFNHDKFKEAVMLLTNDLTDNTHEDLPHRYASTPIGKVGDIIYTLSATRVPAETPYPNCRFVVVSRDIEKGSVVAPDSTNANEISPNEEYVVISWSGGDWPERVESHRRISKLIKNGWLPAGGVSPQQLQCTGEVFFSQALYRPIPSCEQTHLEEIAALLRNRFLN